MDELGKLTGAQLAYELAEDRDGCPLVRLKGELDMTTSPRLEEAVESIIVSGPKRLVIDASELEFADSSAIALLVRWANRIHAVEIRQPPELLRSVIARMGLSERLEVSP